MTVYRAVVRHVSYWRGQVHRWSTVYHFNGVLSGVLDASACNSVRTLDDHMCYGPLPSDGGSYECAIYDQAEGGVPIAVDTVFDWTVPADWPGFTGTAWTTTGAPQLISRETALDVSWAAGLSKSGKPVKLRKWYHALPDNGIVGNGVQVVPTDAASLLVGATALTHALSSHGLLLSSGSGRLAGTASIADMFGNHQMPRGRRRPALVSADGKTRFPAGLLVVPGSDGSLAG